MRNFEGKQKSATIAATGAAIEQILRHGPKTVVLKSCLASIKQALTDESRDSAGMAQSLVRHHHDYFERVIAAKGLPVRAVLGDSNAEDVPEKSTENFSDVDIAEMMPALNRALERSTKDASSNAEKYKNTEIQDALSSFEKWVKTVPVGGTKDKECRKNALVVRRYIRTSLSWDKRFFIAHRRDLIVEIQCVFARHRGAIAARWNWRKWPEGDPHHELNDTVFLVKKNWALKKGLINIEGARYLDDVVPPGVAGCTCDFTYLYNVRDLPTTMVDEQALAAELAKTDMEARMQGSEKRPQSKSWLSRLFR